MAAERRSALEAGLSRVILVLPLVLVAMQLWPEPQRAGPLARGASSRALPPPRVYIDVDGYRVVHPSRPGVTFLPCPSPSCGEAGWDHAALSALLGTIKDAEPEQVQLELVPNPEVSYAVLTATMDASRAWDDGARVLFPAMVVLGEP